MKKWILKAIVQKSISFLPYKHKINYLFQKYITKGVKLSDQYLEDKLVHFQHHWSSWKKYRTKKTPHKVLELGTGWYPVIPICFFLKACPYIITIDISDLLSVEKLKTTISRVLEYHHAGKLQQYVGIVDYDRIRVLEQVLHSPNISLKEGLELLGIMYYIKDARQLTYKDGCVDFIVSNNVFEHIYPEILQPILHEFKRVSAPKGIMSHFIDMSDHFAHLDKNITIYNFLQFSKGEWQRIDNSIQPQNRWRLPQYKKLYEDVAIEWTEEKNRVGDIQALNTVSIDEDFKWMTKEELAISHSYVVSVMN
ncbi:MAG: class I SAM-dependent methyltransferase [Bacteroidota bacterium]